MTRTEQPAHDISVTFVAGVLVCAALIVLGPAAHAGLVFDYTGNLQLDEGRHGQPRPTSVSIDATSGDVLVSDTAGPALHVFHRDGALRFATDMIAGLSSPVDALAFDDGGFVFLDSDGESGRTVRRLDFVGEPAALEIERPVRSWRPEHLAVTADGDFLTLDTTLGLLAAHDADSGAILWTRTLWDAGAELVCGRPAAAPDGRIYIPVSQEHRVLVLSSDGNVLESFGAVGTTPGKFSFPVDVAFGPDGAVLVLDRMRHVIMVFDRDHEFVSEFGSMGSAPGAFYHPISLAYASGRAYVAQGYEGRVQVFDVISTEATERGRASVRRP